MARYEIRFYNAKSDPAFNYKPAGVRSYWTLNGARNKWRELVISYPGTLVFYILDTKTSKQYPRDFE